MTEQVASHSDNVQPDPQEAADAILREHFGIQPSKQQEPPEAETDPSGETKKEDAEQEDEEDKEPPAKEEPKVVRKVKFNKREVEVTEDQLDELLQKGLALDKERERKSELEKALDRAAKLQGYKDHSDYLANLDKIEKEAQKKQESQFDEVKQKLREEAENAGMDPDKVEEWLENNPAMIQAKQILERDKMTAAERQQQEAQQQATEAWSKLFDKYPQLAETVSEDGTDAPWMTDDFLSRIKRGYDPVDAYEVVFRDEILATERKKAEQEALKQQRLNKRAGVLGDVKSREKDADPRLDQVKSAFSAFGLDPSLAEKY